MPEIRLARIVSCSSEDERYPVSNLLQPGGYRCWRGTPVSSGDHSRHELSVIIQLASSSRISAVHIGNDGAAFVAVHVAKLTASATPATATTDDHYHVLLPASSFMSPKEARAGSPLNRVRIFETERLDERARGQSWECVRIVCTQPFNRCASYGLAFVKLFTDTPSTPVQQQQPVSGGGDTVPSANGCQPAVGLATAGADPDAAATLGGKWKGLQLKEEVDDVLRPGGLFSRMRRESNSAAPTANKLVGRSLTVPGDTAVPPRQPLADTSSVSCPSTDSKTKPSQSQQVDSLTLSKPSQAISNHRDHKPAPSNSSKHNRHVTSTDESKCHRPTSPSSSRVRRAPSSSSSPSSSGCPPTAVSARPNGAGNTSDRRRSTDNNTDQKRTPSDQQQRRNPTRHTTATAGPPASARFVPLHALLAGVVFTLSGYQNPRRGQLRDAALRLGARYSPDWCARCTHIVSAFAGTPKLVQAGRRARAVRGEWIEQCVLQRRRLPWRRFAVRPADGTASDSDTDQLVWDEALRPATVATTTTTVTTTAEPDSNGTASEAGDGEHDDLDEELAVSSDEDYQADSDETDTDDEIEAVRNKMAARPGKRPAASAKAKVRRHGDSSGGGKRFRNEADGSSKSGDDAGWLSSRNVTATNKKRSTKAAGRVKKTALNGDESQAAEVSCRKRRSSSEVFGSQQDEPTEQRKHQTASAGVVSDPAYDQSTDSNSSDSGRADRTSVVSLTHTDTSMAELPSFFAGLTFYVDDSSLEPETRRQVRRLAVAFGGALVSDCSRPASYIVTSALDTSRLLQLFGTACQAGSQLVRPSWLFECNSLQALASLEPHAMKLH